MPLGDLFNNEDGRELRNRLTENVYGRYGSVKFYILKKR